MEDHDDDDNNNYLNNVEREEADIRDREERLADYPVFLDRFQLAHAGEGQESLIARLVIVPFGNVTFMRREIGGIPYVTGIFGYIVSRQDIIARRGSHHRRSSQRTRRTHRQATEELGSEA